MRSNACQQISEKVKSSLSQEPVLRAPDFSKSSDLV